MAKLPTPKSSGRKKLNELCDKQIDYVEALLFHGSPFGGQALTALLENYKEHGPFHPIRGEIVQHLHRCLDALALMDGFVVANANVASWAELKRQYSKTTKRRQKRYGRVDSGSAKRVAKT